jgi:hypothetical protein
MSPKVNFRSLIYQQLSDPVFVPSQCKEHNAFATARFEADIRTESDKVIH